ncbi:chemotaxis protein CheW [Oleidesulfovibrio sp.]|uniref:chemotaxis protein CheW n=1 Tax=Oleidesulfovibrio sp. TaxID=2909707 RepID=UPI003A85B31F
MVKTPEEYFKEQDFGVGAGGDDAKFTEAERSFMQKYLGMDEQDVLQRLGKEQRPESVMQVQPDVAAPAVVSEDGQQGMPPEEALEVPQSLEDQMRDLEDVQMVSFYLGEQEFTVPIMAVQEVVRFMQPTKLPAAPGFIAGIVNLRGRVTPLVYLRDLLGIASVNEDDGRFIVICKRKGLQVGLIIDRVHTMYRVPQHTIDWNIESRLGTTIDFVSGLMNSNERLVSIISVDRIVERVLQS